jgi:hypothetical protein
VLELELPPALPGRSPPSLASLPFCKKTGASSKTRRREYITQSVRLKIGLSLFLFFFFSEANQDSARYRMCRLSLSLLFMWALVVFLLPLFCLSAAVQNFQNRLNSIAAACTVEQRAEEKKGNEKMIAVQRLTGPSKANSR